MVYETINKAKAAKKFYFTRFTVRSSLNALFRKFTRHFV